MCYDVEDTKRRNKVAKCMKDFGVRVQKSVFEIYLTQADLEEMLAHICPYIKEEDSLRVYPLQKVLHEQTIIYGQPFVYNPEEDCII